jgi:hypothetical protein
VSAYLYGRWTRSSTIEPSFAPDPKTGRTPVQQAADFAVKLAAVVPADVLVVYGFVLASATESDDQGTTTVTNPTLLKWSLPVLAITASALFLLGKAPKLAKADWLRMLVPPAAFFAWTLITGSNPAALWSTLPAITGGWEFLLGGVIGLLALGVAAALTPPPPK